MADYNLIRSEKDSDSVTGTESDDNIKVYGNHSTVQALGGNDIISVNGGRHDNGIWIGDEDNLINAGAGNDSIAVYSRGASVFGDAGNDTVDVRRSYTFANGGDGKDVLYLRDQYYSDTVNNVTLTGGDGADTFEIVPYHESVNLSAVISDFSNEDSFRVDDDENRVYSYSVKNGNVVITDDKRKYNSFRDTFTEEIEPQFSITLQGVESIDEISDAKFYHYNSAGTVPREYKTFGEMFGVTSNETQPSAQTSETATSPTTTSVTETVPANPTVETSNGGTVNNYYGPVNNYYGDYNDNSVTININISGITVNQNYLTLTQQFTENLWLNGLNLLTNRRTNYFAQFRNIINIDASQLTESKILAGNSQNNIITAGSGGSSMWGSGAGTQNTLRGGNGRDMFFFIGERDIAQNFSTGRNSNSDILNLQSVNLTSYSRENSYMSFGAADGSQIQIQDSSSVNNVVQYTTDGVNTSYAKIGRTNQSNTLTYEDGVNFYSGGSQTDVLIVTAAESKNIWLNGAQGVLYENINDIDATSARGNNQLVGNHTSNKISAGNGNDSLWGGDGNNADDTLIGGAGENTFLYGVNEGNDVIVNSASTDSINLYNVSLSDIVSAGERGTDFVVNMVGGQSLLIKGQNGASNFILSDSSAYSYNRENHSWTQKR